ncbi:polyamine oxidase-like isoform X1 [Amborella trichopoda]|uniref:polyamine oxidase-like isoform X1 n=1 Tax=Amborella trichopoda TaxID=13333 RepID=UPI0009BD96A3|nr:polyamine oxidase-like isoform X1 [Amborella trichopoda]|eukprot:XP_020529593.1 polyamine oxidase-like isoform X1 [Amborella trichopoda]
MSKLVPMFLNLWSLLLWILNELLQISVLPWLQHFEKTTRKIYQFLLYNTCLDMSPKHPWKMAVDYMAYDVEIAEPPRITSLNNVESIPTMSYYGEDEQFVADEHRYKYVVHRLAGEFLETNTGNFLINASI